MVKNYLKTLIMMAKLTVAFLRDLQNTSHPQTLVTQVLKFHWFLPPRRRSRRNGTMKKPAASKISGKSTVKSMKVKTKQAGEKGNFKFVGKKRFKMTLASHQSYIQFQEEGQQKWPLWVACSQSQCLQHDEVIKKIFQETPSSKEKAVELRNFLI